MKKKILSIAVITVFVVLSSTFFALAGIEPSPFQPEINQLGSAQNILISADNRIVKVMGIPPDPYEPSPDLNGALNRLKAINKQVNNVRGFISNTVEAVMGFDPSPFREDVIPALEEVRAASQGIVDKINAYLSYPPDPYIPVEFINALGGVLDSANIIVNETIQYIQQLQGECTLPCTEHTTQAGCESIGCVWYAFPGATGYCCDQ